MIRRQEYRAVSVVEFFGTGRVRTVAKGQLGQAIHDARGWAAMLPFLQSIP